MQFPAAIFTAPCWSGTCRRSASRARARRNFYASWARTSIFATSLVTNFDDSALRQEAANIGAQVDFKFKLKSRYDMTLSVGYATGFLDGSQFDEEYMVSLKIL